MTSYLRSMTPKRILSAKCPKIDMFSFKEMPLKVAKLSTVVKFQNESYCLAKMTWPYKNRCILWWIRFEMIVVVFYKLTIVNLACWHRGCYVYFRHNKFCCLFMFGFHNMFHMILWLCIPGLNISHCPMAQGKWNYQLGKWIWAKFSWIFYVRKHRYA